jgi:hypothetical protein
MFFNTRIVLPTPPSFVKVNCRQRSLITGAGDSTPINDHVPDEM